MKTYLDEDFLLTNETGRRLFFEVAKPLPIFEYHSHVSAKEIFEDKKYRSMTELWLLTDHLKWRALRTQGVPEEFISGEKTDWEKFEKWTNALPETFASPIYFWTHLELQRYFEITELLSPSNAQSIYERCNAKLTHFTARDMLRQSKAEIVCTLDDPLDDLRFHELLAKDRGFSTQIYPTFVMDKALNINAPTFRPWFEKLITLTHPISTFVQLADSLKMRTDFFQSHKCRLSDCSLDDFVFEEATDEEVTLILRKAIAGDALTAKEVAQYKTKILISLGKTFSKLGWVQQIHIQILKNCNTRRMELLGSDSGFDAMDDRSLVKPLAKLLNALDASAELPKTIIFSLNPRDTETIATLTHCFQDSKYPAKIQFGLSDWENLGKESTRRQLGKLADFGLLNRFIGISSGARNVLSLSRHEYFRRLLCDFLGSLVEEGELPNDEKYLKKLISDICYENAIAYFALP